MQHTSIMIQSPCELINITPFNPLISRCQIKVCYVGDEPNRNGSIITKETAREMANSLPGSPIVGFYNDYTNDFEGHNQTIEITGNGQLTFKDTTRPYGFVDLDAKVWFQDYLDDGIVHTYMVTEGWLWTGQYPETKRIIERGNNQSMELDENSLDGSWTIDDKSGMEFFIINEAVISKLCILGEDVEPCFEGANITHFSLDDGFNEKIYALMKEVKNLKGGNSFMDQEKVVETQEEEKEEVVTDFELAAEDEVTAESQNEETVTDPVVDTDFSLEEDQNEEEIEKEEISQDETVLFDLNDFQTLQNDYNELSNRFNELTTQYNTMKEAYDVLVEFKNTKDREAKQAMIDSFYMLSEQDKKDVQDNIDKYSIEDIEAKLSIICVHNKINLSEDNSETNVETTFSFQETEEDVGIPAWLAALRENKK